MDIREENKLSELLDLLGSYEKQANRILIFVERKARADVLENKLLNNNFSVSSIHGDKVQQDRESSLRGFRDGRIQILVATSVASRGLDIPNVSLVIIYDFPSDIDEYVHRIGRTGRAGNPGTSISFFTPQNYSLASSLIHTLKEAQQNIPPWLSSLEKGYYSGSKPNSYSSSSFRDNRFYKGGGGGGGGGGNYRGGNFTSNKSDLGYQSNNSTGQSWRSTSNPPVNKAPSGKILVNWEDDML